MIRIRTNDLTIAAGTHGRGIWQAQLDAAGLANDLNWLERGPNNVGGRTRTIIVDPNDVTGKTIWAGSVAGGLWKTTNIDAVPVSYPEVETKSFSLFPNPATNQINITFNAGTNQLVTIELLDINGNKIDRILNQNLTGQQHINHNLSPQLSKGIFFVLLRIGNQQNVLKVIVG